MLQPLQHQHVNHRCHNYQQHQQHRLFLTGARQRSASAAAPATAALPPRVARRRVRASTSSSATTGAAAHDDNLTALASAVLQHGNGTARRVLSQQQLEGAPLEFLKQTEAYWKALKQQKHEPHKPGPTVITTSSSSTVASILQQQASSSSHNAGSSSSSKPPSFGAAPHPAAPPAAAAAAAGRATSGNAHATSTSSSNSSSSSSSASSPALDFDVVMCGGTLGICVALALQQKGFRVAVVEKRRVEGRLQEWNTSRHEAQVLVDMGLLRRSELEAAIRSEFNPIRVGFKGGAEPLAINDVLNIGVCPKTLIGSLRERFEVLGGVVLEHTAFKSAVVGSDGVVVSLMNAAAAPAGVADTNRPNALQQQEQQLVVQQSPFGQEVAVAGVGRQQQQHSSSTGDASQQHAADASSSRYDRWVSAGAAAVDGAHHGSNGAPAAAPAAAPRSSRRRAPSKLTCRLLLDCMGHYSPIVKQLRGKAKPDGMVLVVGGCATGFTPEANTSADLLYSITDASADMQLFWEAFPAEGGAARTTYMFCYSDADERRPSFEKLLDTYFTLLPAYQGLPSLDAVSFKRVLFGGFPCYSTATPLAPAFHRVLQLGDASATQSPLSFGGFGSMLRHLSRFSTAISHALQDDRLSRQDLAWVHPYQPSLSAAWLFQRSMSLKVGQQQQQDVQENAAAAAAQVAGGSGSSGPTSSSSASPSWLQKLLQLPSNHINALLGTNFACMVVLGQRVLKPFLQDTLQLLPLAATMLGMMLVKPLVIARVFLQVGPKVLLGWFGHFAMLCVYTVAHQLLRPLRHISSSYTWQRLVDACKYGSASDYSYTVSAPGAVAPTPASSTSSSTRQPAHEAAELQPVDAAAAADNIPGRVLSRVTSRQAAANNIVPAVPAAWGQHQQAAAAFPQQQQPQQQPNPA